jgi:hypothetical protein
MGRLNVNFTLRPLYPTENSATVPNEQETGQAPEAVRMISRRDKPPAPDRNRSVYTHIYSLSQRLFKVLLQCDVEEM